MDSIDSWYDFLHDLSLWAIAYPLEFDQVFNDLNQPFKNEAKHALFRIMGKHYVEEINDRAYVNGQEFLILDSTDAVTFKNDSGDTIRVAVIRHLGGASVIRFHVGKALAVVALRNAPKVFNKCIKERDSQALVLH